MVLKVDSCGPTAVLLLDRPEVRNAASLETWVRLAEELRRLAKTGCRAAVLAGAAGPFSSGGDLGDDGSGGVGAFSSHQRLTVAHDALQLIAELPFPVIAAVEQYAVGIGWSLAMACDIVLAAEDAWFSAPFLDRGVTPDGGGWWRVERSLGRHYAAEIILSGRRVPATELARLGLVGLTPPGGAVAGAQELAAKIATRARETVQLSKKLIRDGEQLDFAGALSAEVATGALNSQFGHPAEGRRAFLEGREPDFISTNGATGAA